MPDRAILVVDDDRDIRELTADVLGGAGYAVRTAASGAAALDELAARPCDLVLLDINMPGMDGWETLRRIRSADDDLAALRVVMFSVRDELRQKLTGLQEGADDYVTKPFAIEELLERVRGVLARSRPAGV